MPNKEIGTVISTIDGPSPSNLDFVVDSGSVHRGQFVEMDYSEGKLIALITDVIKTNRYFERAESVKEFENSGTKLFEQFPTSEWEYLVAKTRPLGVYSGELIKRASYPPSPGTKVRVAEKETLKDFLEFDEANGLHLGNVEFHDLDAKLNITKLFQKHVAVLAMSGSGKSYLVSVMFEELLQRKKEQGRLAVVVMDAHGEYTSFAMPTNDQKYKDFSSKTRIVRANEIEIGVPKLSLGILNSMLPGLSGPQKRDLGKIIAKLRKEMKSGLGPFDFKGLKSEILKDADVKESTKAALLGWINGLEELNLFGKIDNPSISDLVKPGTLTIVDLSDIINLKKKQIIVNYFARKLFEDRRNKLLPPFLLVLEEAHQFSPERAASEVAIARSIVRTIAREGRKFGASLCLISQRPIQLDTTTLAQCNTHIILRITNPYDLKHIGESSEGLDRRSLDMITALRVGEALIVGEAVNYPVFFKVRTRLSQPSKHETTLEKAALDFENKKERSKSETEVFL